MGVTMINVYTHDTLGNANLGWLKTYYHFSFADYYNPQRMQFGNLRVINDDTIQPGTGFAKHHHRDMEIITYVTQGAITHKDSEGNEGRIEAGNVQVMTAGSGIYHSEHNLEKIETKLFQIWIKPRSKNLKPNWKSHIFPNNVTQNSLYLIASGNNDAPLHLNQDARIFAGNLEINQTISHHLKTNAYIVVTKGKLLINNFILGQGDGAEIINTELITLQAFLESNILLIEI